MRSKLIARALSGRVALLLAALVVFSTSVGSRHAAAPSNGILVFTHLTVIDGSGAAPRAGQTVVIKGGRIAAIGHAGDVAVPESAQVVDARGKYLIPGLWDMHVHLSIGGEALLPIFVANGVTAVRDLGGDFAAVQSWQKKIAAGSLIGPRIYAAGKILESPHFLALLERLSGMLGPPHSRLLTAVRSERIPVGSEEDAENAVQEMARQGAACIKFRMNTTAEIFQAILAAANRAGLPVAGHSPQAVSLTDAAAAGQKSFEHVFTSPEEASLELEEVERFAAALKQQQAYPVPTLVTFHHSRLLAPGVTDQRLKDLSEEADPRNRFISPALANYWRLQHVLDQFEDPQDWQAVQKGTVERLRVLQKAGVRFLAGTDFGARFIYPGFSLHDELELLVAEAGLTPMEALQAATRNAAQFFGETGRTGMLERGKLAEMVLLEANPLADIRNTRKIAGVVAAGVYYDRAALDRLLAVAAEADANSPPNKS